MTTWDALSRRALLLLAALACCAPAGTASAQHTISINELMNETQIVSEAANDLTVVWWIPNEYWEASFAQDPSVTQEQADQIVSMLSPYTVVGIVDGNIGPVGGVTYQSEDVVRAAVSARGGDGRTHVPLDAADVDPDTTNLFNVIKPVLTNIVGPMGENMHFFVFQSDGGAIADPRNKGKFTVFVSEREFTYRLPLGSILPPRHDPETGEQFPGNYSYNPFTGNELASE